MDFDVEMILKLSEMMKERLKHLEARQTLTKEQDKAAADAAKQFRWLRAVHLSELRAAFDPEYRGYLENLTKSAKSR